MGRSFLALVWALVAACQPARDIGDGIGNKVETIVNGDCHSLDCTCKLHVKYTPGEAYPCGGGPDLDGCSLPPVCYANQVHKTCPGYTADVNLQSMTITYTSNDGACIDVHDVQDAWWD